MNCFRSGILLSVGSYGMWRGGTGSDRFGCDWTDCGKLASGTVMAAISVERIGCGNDADKMCVYTCLLTKEYAVNFVTYKK